MEDFELIEADFQQFYGLDLLQVQFRRYARLLLQLPAESRFLRKYNPLRDWNWDKETQSQILQQLDGISCQLANMVRKKGAKKIKPQKQMQPDYVEKAKKELEHKDKNKDALSQEEVTKLDEAFKKRYPKVKFLGGGNGK